jgi:ubiquinone/menaquinone biosynthesis C-methylase UbiE
MMTQNYFKGSFVGLKEFWEERGKTGSFERDYSIRLEGIRRIVDEVRPYIRGRLVLDVGCGPGIAAGLFPRSSRVTGLDFSVSMLKSARSLVHDLVQGSAFNLPFHDSSFDVITCLFVASDYSNKAGIFCEAYRVLGDNGVFLFSDYSLNDGHWKFRRTIRPLMGEPWNIFLKDEASLSKVMNKAGFKVQETNRLQFYAPFRLERYVKSEDELHQLKTNNLDLWNDLQRCIRNRKIDREFLLIIGAKKKT